MKKLGCFLTLIGLGGLILPLFGYILRLRHFQDTLPPEGFWALLILGIIIVIIPKVESSRTQVVHPHEFNSGDEHRWQVAKMEWPSNNSLGEMYRFAKTSDSYEIAFLSVQTLKTLEKEGVERDIPEVTMTELRIAIQEGEKHLVYLRLIS